MKTILGSHNSWSYLSPKCWLLKPFAFVAKCQDVDIKKQYEKYGVRCFDLRIRFDNNGKMFIAHGKFVYDIDFTQLMEDLNYLDRKGDCYLRIINEVRTKKQYDKCSKTWFTEFCEFVEVTKPNITCWCGRNLYNWNVDYNFYFNPTCEELYSSVCSPKLLDDWYPKIYAKRKNKKNIKKGTKKDILLIDFVNIQ